MNHLAAYYLHLALSTPQTREDQPEPPPEPPAPRWQRAALLRGFYTAQQTAAATRLTLAHFIGANITKPASHIAHWERQIKANDIHPATPGRMKSVWSFLLHMAGYIGPVIAIGSTITVGAGMFTSGGIAALAGIAATCLINTHQAAGEAFLQTARTKKDLELHEDDVLHDALADHDFRRSARNNVLLKSGISLTFTAAAGPAARLFGSFSNGIIHGLLLYTPFGRMIGRELARSIETGLLRSMNTSLGGFLANLSIRHGKGPEHIAAAFGRVAAASTAIVTVIRGATNAVFNRVAALPDEKQEPATPTATVFAAIAAPEQDTSVDEEKPDLPPAALTPRQTAQHAPRP